MTLASELVAETREHLLHGTREQMNKLASAVAVDATTITLSFDLKGIREGSILSMGLERMHVWSIVESTKQVVVERGWDASTPAAHAAGVLVRVNSRFDDFSIFRALNDDLIDLSSPGNGLFRVRIVERTFTSSTYGYDLAPDIVGSPMMVQSKVPGGTGHWHRLDKWRFDPSADVTDFPSGRSLHLTEGGYPGRAVRIVYRAPFSPLTALSNDVELVSFLPASCHDIPPLGAAARLLAGRAVRRSDLDAQGSTRRAEEVQGNDALASPRGLLAQRQSRINAEASRLAAAHPVLL